jgi:hypothetical protein
MLFIGVGAWTADGIHRHDAPIYLCNAVTGSFVLMVAAVKARSDRLRTSALASTLTAGDRFSPESRTGASVD